MKHNYTNELELKSIIIRIQTARKLSKTTGSSKTIAVNSPKNIRDNRKINKYIKLVSNLSKKSETNKERFYAFKAKVTNFIIKKSENTPIDNINYERFGFIIMEIVRHILTKPQFRGYIYYDDFMSDSVFKILKYLDNFDHTIISKRSGEPVKAFAYISQIITNSIIFIISKNKKEQDFIKQQLSIQFNNDNILEPWEVKKKTEDAVEKEVFVKSKGIIKRIYDTIESEKEFLKSPKNTLVIRCSEMDDVDIDELSAIESIKRVYKNVKFNPKQNKE